MKITNYKELEIWKRSLELTIEIYTITNQYPKSEVFGITSQMRRAAFSAPSNIAEGWVRNSTPSLIYFLNISNSSLSELETFIIISERLNYLNQESSLKLTQEINEISKMIYGLTNYLKKKSAKTDN